MARVLLGIMTAFWAFMAPPSAAVAMEKFVALGTGSTRGTYYPVGRGICDLINGGRTHHRVRCIAYSTGGSVYNIQAITSGELEMGITRSDLAFESHDGVGGFTAIGPNRDLRAVTTLYSMPIAVLVRKGADITTFADLKGKRINIGNKGSGKRSVADLIFNVMEWSEDDFDQILELPTKQMGEAFCDEKVDILIEGLGNPAAFYAEMIDDCDGKFINVPGIVVDKIKRKFPYYSSLTIPGEMYTDTPKPVHTFGFKATLVTRRDVHPDTVYWVVESIFDNFGKFRTIHPSLELADPAAMVNEGIFIPVHDGALRFYREQGIK